MPKISNFLKTRKKENSRESGNGEQRERLTDLLIHDLTSPLSIIAASVSNLLHKTERYGPVTEQQKRLLERVSRNTRKAQALLHEMIEIMQAKEGFLRIGSFEIEKMLQNSLSDALEQLNTEGLEELCQIRAFEEFQTLLQSRGVILEITGKYLGCPFSHDQRKVEQILRNLTSNALKYRRRRVDITISGEDDLQISVKDDGLGIHPEKQEFIFEPFVGLNEKRDSEIPGLGLGLAGVKCLVEAIGGEITFKSDTETGTSFFVRIPALT